jgi:hypothetical protein
MFCYVFASHALSRSSNFAMRSVGWNWKSFQIIAASRNNDGMALAAKCCIEEAHDAHAQVQQPVRLARASTVTFEDPSSTSPIKIYRICL